MTDDGRKIRYVVTGMELGEIHKEYKETMYRCWGHLPDADLAIYGLVRVDEPRDSVPAEKTAP